jgi:hypothetical protein
MLSLGGGSQQQFDDSSLFALSDVLEEVNKEAIIRHVMSLYECVVGRPVDKGLEGLGLD